MPNLLVKLKYLLCAVFGGHRWEVAPDFDLLKPGVPDFVCTRCGKKEGL